MNVQVKLWSGLSTGSVTFGAREEDAGCKKPAYRWVIPLLKNPDMTKVHCVMEWPYKEKSVMKRRKQRAVKSWAQCMYGSSSFLLCGFEHCFAERLNDLGTKSYCFYFFLFNFLLTWGPSLIVLFLYFKFLLTFLTLNLRVLFKYHKTRFCVS